MLVPAEWIDDRVLALAPDDALVMRIGGSVTMDSVSRRTSGHSQRLDTRTRGHAGRSGDARERVVEMSLVELPPPIAKP